MASPLTVNLESIRGIPVAFPSLQEVDDINLEHRKILENMSGVLQPHKVSMQSQGRILTAGYGGCQHHEQTQGAREHEVE